MKIEQHRSGLRSLLAVKARIGVHVLRLAMRHKAVRVLASVAAVGVIWLAMFLLFSDLFGFLVRGPSPLVGFVVLGYTFSYFFAALTAMLVLSNAVLLYGMLFRSEETGFLLSGPFDRRAVFLVKYLEALVLSSWAFVMLGVPVMAAYGVTYSAPAWFYAFFTVLFVAFLPIPASVGALLAVGLARLFGGRAGRAGLLLLLLLVVLAVAAVQKAFQTYFFGVQYTGAWFQRLLTGLDVIRHPLLPSDWVSRGLLASINGRWTRAAFYLWLTLINGLFFALVTVRVGGRWLASAYDRTLSHRRARPRRRAAWPNVLRRFLNPLPAPLRLIVVKDVMGFVRDPLQWCQFLIFFGLLIIYILNLPNFRFGASLPMWDQTISFLNLTAVGLILSTFTGRFVFPMVSLEGRRIWLLGMLPVERKTLVYAKFLFAAGVTGATAVGITALSDAMLELPPAVRLIHVSMALVISCGLAGIAVGMGARLPNFRQSNASQIASGFGGTMNLMVSLGYIALMLALFGFLDFSPHVRGFLLAPWSATLVVLAAAGILGLGALATIIPLKIGIRHFTRLEF